MNLPLKYLTKMGLYDLQMNGVDIKVRVVDDPAVVECGLAEIKSLLGGDLKLVGIDLKEGNGTGLPQLLLFYVQDRCLIIHLGRIPNRCFTNTLADFLNDTDVCFVGFEIVSKLNRLTNYLKSGIVRPSWSFSSAKGVDI